MLTWTPDNSYSSYSCNYCGISDQIIVQLLDPVDGSLLFAEDGTPLLVNDEPAASAELGEHVVEAHPQ